MFTTLEFVPEIDHVHHHEKPSRIFKSQAMDILDSLDDPVFLLDPESGSLLFANRNGLVFFDLSQEDIPYVTLDAISTGISPYNRDVVLAGLSKASQGEPQRFEWVAKKESGELFHAEIHLKSVTVEGQIRILAVIKDITKRKQSEEQNTLSFLIFENATEGIIVTASDDSIKMVNPAAREITGFSVEDLLNKKRNPLYSNRQTPDFYKAIQHALQNKNHWRGEIWGQRKDGEFFPALLSLTAIKDGHDKITHVISVFHDITETKRDQERIQHQAKHDMLTGLLNRAFFSCQLTHNLLHAHKSGNRLSVLFIDLDNFKRINDSLGHEAGDQLLQTAAKRLTACVREEDTVARFGGDEFTIILNQVHDENRVIKVAQRILDSLAEPILIKENLLQIGASIGITMFPHDGKDPGTLIRNADMAMYRAKEMGRNNFQFFTPDMNELVMKQMNIENQIRLGLENDEFIVYYQPKVDIQTNNTVSMEALVRWKKPHVGIISPNDFIPAAEESGLIIPLGYKVLREACLAVASWQKKGYPDLSISVNISAKQFQQKDLVCTIAQILKETEFSPTKLELEITESAMMHDVESAISSMCALADMGITLSVDDFGTGYSSLHYIKKFPVSVLKVDKSFVQDIVHDPKSAALVNSIITLAHSLHLKVIAEGVENTEQLQHLRQWNCDMVQGYLYCRPLSKQDMDQYLVDNTQYGGL